MGDESMAIIHYFAPLRGMTGVEEERVDAAAVSDVLKHIRCVYGKAAHKAAKSALIVVNGVSIGLYAGDKTVLKADDVVGFLPLCGGG